MRKFTAVSTLAITMILGMSSFAQAQGFVDGQQAASVRGGYTGPGIAPMTVKEALSSRDDTPVVLIGRIEKSLGDEKYSFKDETGVVVVEIDNEDWRGLSVGPDDLVEISGEVDKDFTRTEIDVNTVIKKQ